MFQYIKIAWVSADDIVHEGYQEISGGNVLRNTDLDGNTVNFEALGECTSWVIDPEPTPPIWAQ